MPIIDRILDDDIRTSALNSAYDEQGSHFIEETEGKYSITFMYRQPESDQAIAQEVELDCPDLYEWMLDDNGEPRKFTKDPNSSLYSLRIDNISSDTFATYQIKINGIVAAPANQKLLTMHHLDLHKEPITVAKKQTEYIQLPDAKVPSCFNLELPTTLKGSVTSDTFKPSEQFPQFTERDTWVYKPSGFDRLDPKKRKVIFMLDGKDFCEKLTPYIDGKGESFSNTAIVYIDPGKYQTPGPPARVSEDYFQTDDFSKLLSEELIDEYTKKLGVDNNDNILLAAHSLAAYPIIDLAARNPGKFGGVFLFSPALNQNKAPNFPINPSPELKDLLIWTQIGKNEDAMPPKIHQEKQDMQSKSRLKSTQETHQALVTQGYNVKASLQLHSYGHDSIHVFEGLEAALTAQQHHLIARDTMRFKSSLNKIKGSDEPVIAIDETVQQAPRPY